MALPTIPEYITVHLGSPDDRSAPNVTVPFIDYINVLILDSGNLTSEETKYRNDITFIIS